MQGTKFTISFYIPGAITSDKTLYVHLDTDCQLIHVSAQCITQDATLKIYDDGTQVNDSLTVTAGTTPLEQSVKGDFVGDQFPHFAAASVLKIVVGHGSNAVDVNFVLTFTEG